MSANSHAIPGSNNQDFRQVSRMWPDLHGRLTLDIGCGQGLYTKELKSRGATVVGMDVRLDVLRRARSQCNSDVKWLVGDACKLPFKDGAFDVGLSVEVLGHLSPKNRISAVDEMKRVIKDSGMVCITMHNRIRLSIARWLRLRRALTEYRTPSLNVWPSVPGEVNDLFTTSGFVRQGSEKYLNYHSRFTHSFFIQYPRISMCVMAIEDLLSLIPGLNKLGITFALVFRRSATVR